MIKPKQVPKDSAEVVIDKLLELVGIDVEPEEAQIIVAAALNAWPDVAERVMPYAALILPLPPQEPIDAKR